MITFLAYLKARQLAVALFQILSQDARGQRADVVLDVHHVDQGDLQSQEKRK